MPSVSRAVRLVSVLRMCVTCCLFRWQPRPAWPGVWCGCWLHAWTLVQKRTAILVSGWLLKKQRWLILSAPGQGDERCGGLRSRTRSSCRPPAVTGDVRASCAGDRAEAPVCRRRWKRDARDRGSGRHYGDQQKQPAGRPARGRGERRRVAVAAAPAGRESLPLLNRTELPSALTKNDSARVPGGQLTAVRGNLDCWICWCPNETSFSQVPCHPLHHHEASKNVRRVISWWEMFDRQQMMVDSSCISIKLAGKTTFPKFLLTTGVKSSRNKITMP